jgi:hypothetical protein
MFERASERERERERDVRNNTRVHERESSNRIEIR